MTMGEAHGISVGEHELVVQVDFDGVVMNFSGKRVAFAGWYGNGVCNNVIA